VSALDVVRFRDPIPYAEMLQRQRAAREEVERGERGPTLFLLEHPPTITRGRKSDASNILLTPEALAAQGIALEDAERGGDVTYHGPGQLVAYPILDLHQLQPSVGWYIRRLEEAIIQLLAGYGLEGDRIEGMTGVWVDGAKVAAIGIGIHHWVTFHGCAINVDPNMAHFQAIVPCGIADKPVTSLRALLGKAPEMDEVAGRFEQDFRSVFEL